MEYAAKRTEPPFAISFRVRTVDSFENAENQLLAIQ
jgi:hypothetical protein